MLNYTFDMKDNDEKKASVIAPLIDKFKGVKNIPGVKSLIKALSTIYTNYEVQENRFEIFFLSRAT